MLSNLAELPGLFPEARIDGEDMGIILGMAGMGERAAAAALPDPKAVQRAIVENAAPGISRLVARDLSKDPEARRLVMISYLTAPDPMAEYREVAWYDYMNALDRAFPESASMEWYEAEEPDEEGPVGEWRVDELDDEEDYEEGMGELGKFKISKKMRKRLKKIGKVVAVGAAVVGAVALGIVTAGAAVPLIASVGTTAFSMMQAKKKAKAEAKSIKQAEAELAAMNEPVEPPPPGQIAETASAAVNATAAQYQGNPSVQGSVAAQGQIVQGVIPQGMASYAAGQVQGKTPEQLAAELGVSVEDIKSGRIGEAGAVAAGAEPSGATPGWVLPAAIGGGGLLIALVGGVF